MAGQWSHPATEETQVSLFLMQFRSSRRLPALLVALLIGAVQTVELPVAAAAEHPVPLALPPSAAPWTNTYEARQHRVLECESKSRLVAGRFLTAASEAAGRPTDKSSANMELYDVRFYDLDLDFNPTTRILSGTALIRAEVVGASLSQMVLDLNLNMYVPAARSGGLPTTYSRASALLTVDLDRTYVTGETVEVGVDYYGNPSGDYFGWSLYGGQPLIWTLSEPYGARDWWPCKDLNTDKADSVALHVTVPDNLVVASNGTLDKVAVPSAGRKTYHWTERYPIAPYLVSVTAHPFAVFTDQYVSAAGDTMPLEYYVVPDRLATATAGYAVMPAMIGTLAGLFGEYPFITEKYGHAHFPWGGGMEHQTCTSLHYNGYSEGLLVHELGHQWFGDRVTCADFAHIWINEGFATWCEAYWLEQSVGTAAYRAEMADARYLGPGTIIIENPADFWGIFDFNLSYQKASWVPHMLRRVVGETGFQTALQNLLTDHGFGVATTADVQAQFEAVSGLDLTKFFDQWIYGAYYPAYEFSWQAVPEGGQTRVLVRIAQTQANTGLFTMPLDVRVSTGLGDTTFVVQNSLAEQWYDFVVDGTVSDVQLDPDDWVLCTVTPAGVSEVPAPVAAVARLLPNVPNPFNPATTIRYETTAAGEVRLDVHDVAGRLVKNLVAGTVSAGDHQVRWNGTDSAGRAVASGTYFVRLQGEGGEDVRPLTLVR